MTRVPGSRIVPVIRADAVRLCINCAFFVSPEEPSTVATCSNPSGVNFSFVDGRAKGIACDTLRSSTSSGSCGHEAEWFESNEIIPDVETKESASVEFPPPWQDCGDPQNFNDSMREVKK